LTRIAVRTLPGKKKYRAHQTHGAGVKRTDSERMNHQGASWYHRKKRKGKRQEKGSNTMDLKIAKKNGTGADSQCP